MGKKKVGPPAALVPSTSGRVSRFAVAREPHLNPGSGDHFPVSAFAAAPLEGLSIWDTLFGQWSENRAATVYRARAQRTEAGTQLVRARIEALYAAEDIAFGRWASRERTRLELLAREVAIERQQVEIEVRRAMAEGLRLEARTKAEALALKGEFLQEALAVLGRFIPER